jgi:arylsulfatase A-like enzyme
MLRILRAFLVAAAAALLTAGLHLTVTTVERDLLGHFSWMWWTRDQLWVTPLSYLVVFAGLAIPAAVLHLLAPRRISLPAVASAFVGLSALSVLLLFDRIASWAWVLVALGVAVQGYRWFGGAAGERLAVRLASATLAIFGLGFAVLGGGAYWRVSSQERSAMAALADAPAGAPNVLLLILDTVRAQEFGLHGSPLATTPAMDRRAREGLVFERAYSTAPWTLPSHASMFTGHYASQQSGDWATPLDDAHATLAERLRDRGYATGGFVANLISTGYRTGLARGFIRYEDVERSFAEVMHNTTLAQSVAIAGAWRVWRETRWVGGVLRQLATFDLRPNGNYTSHERKNSEEVVGDFLRWQGSLEGRPFFAFLNLFDAHGPYMPPAPYREMFEPKGLALGRYRGAIRYMDDQIDSLLNTLERRGVLQNTIVVISSDHGELFGEHKLTGHGNALYLPQLHVPLIVLAPGRVPAGTRVPVSVSLRDLPATILDLAGVAPGEARVPGTSLLRVARGEAGAVPSRVIAEVNAGINDDPQNPTAKADLKTAVDDTLHAIATSRGALEAYAHAVDPDELTDLARDTARRPAVAAWVDRMLDSVGVQWPRRATPRIPASRGTP